MSSWRCPPPAASRVHLVLFCLLFLPANPAISPTKGVIGRISKSCFPYRIGSRTSSSCRPRLPLSLSMTNVAGSRSLSSSRRHCRRHLLTRARAQVTLSQASRSCRSGGLTSRYTEGWASEAESLVPPQTYTQAPITVKFMKHITSSAYS